MRFGWLILAVLLGGGAVPATAQSTPSDPATSGLGIRLLDAPGDRRDDPRAQVYIVDHVQPKASLSRRVEVVNGTASAGQVALYPAAAEIAEGSFGVRPGRGENDLTGWMRVTPATLDLAPGQKGVATVEIDVPAGAGGGERYAALMAEMTTRSAAPGIAVASRVGVRVYLSVGGPAEPASDLEISTLQAVRRPDGRPAVTAQVRNTGDRALDMSGTLELSEGPGGLSAGPFPAELGTTLAPGDSSAVDVVLEEAIQGGPWRAVLTLRSGRLERTVEGTITFPDAAGSAADPVTAVPLVQNPRIVVPVAAGLLAAVVVSLGVVLLTRRHNRRSSP
ncbi:MAG: peptidase [Mycobacteriales bacterium]